LTLGAVFTYDDWEYNALILCHGEDINSSYEIRKNAPAEETKYVKHYLDFWTAPEIISGHWHICRQILL
jgi:hypothetical protein